MKLSVSLPAEDIDLLDGYVSKCRLPSRSAGIRAALHLLRHQSLEDDYAAAWDEWERSGEADAWADTIGDGLDAAR